MDADNFQAWNFDINKIRSNMVIKYHLLYYEIWTSIDTVLL